MCRLSNPLNVIILTIQCDTPCQSLQILHIILHDNCVECEMALNTLCIDIQATVTQRKRRETEKK